MDAGWVETRAPDKTGTFHYASNAMLERVPGIGSTIYEREQVKKKREKEREVVGAKGDSQGREEKRSVKETWGGWRIGKGCFVISWSSPRVPSCVLNHFPVDSAVCNPIISVSPPGKLLFYSRTTRAPDVPCTTYSRSLFFFFFPFSFHSLFRLRREVDFHSAGAHEFFFPTTSRSFSQSLARARPFRSIRLYRREFFRLPKTGSTDSKTGWMERE